MTRRNKYIRVDYEEVVEVYRKCNKCFDVSALEPHFRVSKRGKNGHEHICKKCINIKVKINRREPRPPTPDLHKYTVVQYGEVIDIIRPCNVCGSAYYISEGFYSSNSCKRGHKMVCKSCDSADSLKRNRVPWYVNPRPHEFIDVRYEDVVEIIRGCTKCGTAYEVDSGFHVDMSGNHNRMSICKHCRYEEAAKYCKENIEALTASRAAYRAARLRRTPFWVTKEHKIEMAMRYTEAKKLKEETGVVHHVDHIVPMQGGKVSGLHVPWNLQVITATENLQKSNKYTLWGDDDAE